ncbi:hypothetical protein EX30DRAFT_396879 [Ascodesmis nigricans]|uniref:Uncharacterized protein n=1 Tax=Ascodesmis nigricans TaxID=341454 RepID=A0A4V3SIF7_9PEZI|nr:hypothetical protein EX30DRAFT_396879 [Ascodesmis nigricans]
MLSMEQESTWPSPDDHLAVAALFAGQRALEIDVFQNAYRKLYNSHNAAVKILTKRAEEAEIRFDSMLEQNDMLIGLLSRVRKVSARDGNFFGSRAPSVISYAPSTRAKVDGALKGRRTQRNFTATALSTSQTQIDEGDSDEEGTVKATTITKSQKGRDEDAESVSTEDGNAYRHRDRRTSYSFSKRPIFHKPQNVDPAKPKSVADVIDRVRPLERHAVPPHLRKRSSHKELERSVAVKPVEVAENQRGTAGSHDGPVNGSPASETDQSMKGSTDSERIQPPSTTNSQPVDPGAQLSGSQVLQAEETPIQPEDHRRPTTGPDSSAAVEDKPPEKQAPGKAKTHSNASVVSIHKDDDGDDDSDLELQSVLEGLTGKIQKKASISVPKSHLPSSTPRGSISSVSSNLARKDDEKPSINGETAPNCGNVTKKDSEPEVSKKRENVRPPTPDWMKAATINFQRKRQ